MESKSEDTVVFDNWYTSFSLFFFFQYYKITSDVSTNFQKLQWVPFLCVSIPKLMFVSDIVSKRFVLYLWIPEIIADTDYTVLWLAGETFFLVFFCRFSRYIFTNAEWVWNLFFLVEHHLETLSDITYLLHLNEKRVYSIYKSKLACHLHPDTRNKIVTWK